MISFARSEQTQTLDKTLPEFQLHEKFKIEKKFPGVPESLGIDIGNEPATLSTILGNGLTIATEQRHGLMNSIAFLVKTGSSHEHQAGDAESQNTGVTHFMELNGFRSTQNRTVDQLIAEVEALGGMIQCVSTRENIIYCIDVLQEHTEKALDILADTVMNPTFPEAELDMTKQIIQFQRDQFPPDMLSKDAIQRAAYKGSPLSNHHFCPAESAEGVSVEKLQAFREQFFTGGNCVLSAALCGIGHEEFAHMAALRFGGLTPQVESAPRKLSWYTGGMVVEERQLQEPFVKVAMAFEVGGWKDDQLVASCVMQQLLGGGSSFSAGGPGKGMYTRLYTQVLNRNYWTESVEAFLSIHDESGIFGIDGACPPEATQQLIKVIVEQLTKLGVEEVEEEELNRAKNMLKSMMMMQLESRLILCEDIARQFSTYGKRDYPGVVCDKIDAVTAADILAVGKRMMASAPSISIVGHEVKYAPAFEEIENYLSHYRKNELVKRQIASF